MRKKKRAVLLQTTVEFLDAIKEKYSLESDTALAQKLQTSKQVLSNYRHGRQVLMESDGITVAKLLDLEPLYVLSCALAEKAARANRTDEKAVWEDLMKRLSVALAGPVMAFGFMSSPAPVHAEPTYSQASNINYTNKRRRKMATA